MIKKITGNFDEKFKRGGELPWEDINVYIFEFDCGDLCYCYGKDKIYYVNARHVGEFISYCNSMHFDIHILNDTASLSRIAADMAIEMQRAIEALKKEIGK